MTGDNTVGMKDARAYKRLICAILELQPEKIIKRLAYEYCEPGDNLKGFEDKLKDTINSAIIDSANYTIHYQGGRAVPIRKESLIAKKLLKESLMPKKKEEKLEEK